MTIVQETNHAAVDATTTRTVKHWINGVQTDGTTGRTQPTYNPPTGEVSAQLTLGDASTVDEAEMVGINVPIPVPVGTSRSVAGRTHLSATTTAQGSEGLRFYSRAKVVTTRWPHEETLAGPSMNFPGNN